MQLNLKKILNALGFLMAAAIILIFISTSDPTNYPPKNNVVVAFGDSLVQGVGSTPGGDFVTKLAQKIGKPIINMGVSGDTSQEGLARIQTVISKKPGMVLVLFGGNDFLQKVPRKETFENLRNIIIQLQSSGAMVVLLGVRGGALTDPFAAEYRHLAEETDSIYVSDVLDGLLGNSKYMSDAIHPNDFGYEMISQKIYKGLRKYLK